MSKKQPETWSPLKKVALCAVFLAAAYSIANKDAENKKAQEKDLAYTEVISKVKSKDITKIELKGREIVVEGPNVPVTKSYLPEGVNIFQDTQDSGVTINAVRPDAPPFLTAGNIISLSILGIMGYFLYSMIKNAKNGGAGGAFGFGKSKAKKVSEEDNHLTFADVAGCDEAKEAVTEMVDFLRDPSKYTRTGGKMPRGILMTGDPGVGKTLMAKAMAGEAKVPFYTISGSDFVEMYVGVGASRVREMFKEAKENSPCIIFIDEIDAVGRKRGESAGGGNDEREQTLNQLLVEMDGFSGDSGVIVIAATNRADVLDPALKRPGRFDREVHVPLPDLIGREQILQVHIRKVPAAQDVNLKILAAGTPGFSGASLANLVNEAAIFAARRNKKMVDMSDFESARDKLIMGAETRMKMSEEELDNTAWHEAGHAIVSMFSKGLDPVYKVSIIPRGRALGVTVSLPEQDRHSYTQDQLKSRLAMLYGGRVAEEMRAGGDKGAITTGASNDIEVASNLAKNMVTRWGFSKVLGPRFYTATENELMMRHPPVYSESLQGKIDSEITDLLLQGEATARTLLAEQRDLLERMVVGLLKYETLDRQDLQDLRDGNDISARKDQQRRRALAEVESAKAKKPAAVPTYTNPVNDNDASGPEEEIKPYNVDKKSGMNGGPR